MSSSSGISQVTEDVQRLQDEAEERRQFEEDRFVRLTLSRKDKKAINKRQADASRLDNLADIGDIGEFEELAELSRSAAKYSQDSAGESLIKALGVSNSERALDLSSTALKRAVGALSSSKHGFEDDDYDDDGDDDESGAIALLAAKRIKTQKTSLDSYDDEDDDSYGFGAILNGTNDSNARRRAPDSSMNDEAETLEDGDDDRYDDVLENFSKKKKDFAAKKKAHYTPAPRYGGLEGEEVDDGRKRAATYEIIKNRGLTPHRKKANSNPRVKKREKYAKAITARKGQVRDVITGAAGSYGGEMTGIKSNLARSRKISN